MPNEAVTKTENGLTLTVNEDRTIAVTGKATASGSLTIAGTISNRNPLMTIKANEPYFLAELPTGYKWAFYYYSGTEREQVYFEKGGLIELTEDKQITHIELVWTAYEELTTENEEGLLTENGLQLMLEGEEVATNTIIYPMLNVGSSALEYMLHEDNRTVIDLGSNSLNESNSVVYENGTCKIGSKTLKLDRIFNTYNPNSVIYSLDNVYLDVDYKKSSFEYVTAIGSNGALILKNTADGYGSIRKLTLENLAGETVYTLTSSNGSDTEAYLIDLSKYTGIVTVVIENGVTTVFQNGEKAGTVEDIYIKTYSPKTYLEIDNNSKMTCEYMLESDFSIYCTRVEKDASIKMVEDMIQLEVTRASGVEGELSSKITVEAGKIEQIVTSVGNSSGKVTPASIVASINDASSSVKISADHIDIEGTEFPRIASADGRNSIEAGVVTPSGSIGIDYTARGDHEFNGGVILNDKLTLNGITSIENAVYDENSDIKIGDILKNGTAYGIDISVTDEGDYNSIGVQLGYNKATSTINIDGKLYINGILYDGIAKFG